MGSPDEARVRLPQLRLDELLDELEARLDAARGTRDRVHSLLEAVLSVGRELDSSRLCAASWRPRRCWSTRSTRRSE